MKLINALINRFNQSETIVLIIILVITSALYLANLSINGYANSYYTAAVQAASTSWKAFFFGSLDGASFISVDKPPVAIWLMALSVRLFGLSSFAMLLPNALAGVITVWLVYATIKKHFGLKSAVISAIVMNLTPVAALMFRFNNPDAILTLFLAASGYTFIKSLDAKKPLIYLALTAIFTGFAFNTKMLQGLVLLPIMVPIYLFFAQPPKFFTRLWHLLFALLITLIAALWWPVIVWLTPASSRPYIGSSTNNSIWDLIVGYNGLNRLLGNRASGGFGALPQFEGQTSRPTGNGFPGGGQNNNGNGGLGGMTGPGGSGFGGQTGILRMFNTDFGVNIGWLIPFALISGLTGLIRFFKPLRFNLKRSVILFFFGWLIIHVAVFSITSGTIHPYYVVVLAPAIAALVGIGLPLIWQIYKTKKIVWLVLPLSIGITAYTSYVLLGYSNYWPWLRYGVIISATISIILLIINHFQTTKIIPTLAIICFIFTALAGPAAFTYSTLITAHTGSIPTSGPGATAGRTNNESASADQKLVDYLVANRDGATWIVAVASANESAPIQISSGEAVMAVGGFNGNDSALTVDQLKKLVAMGQLKYYLVTDSRGGGGSMGGGNNSIASWVKEYGTVVDYGSSTAGTLYLLE